MGLVYVIYVQISLRSGSTKKRRQVIDHIKDIRTAQRAFKSKYQHFTAGFDSLSAFVLTTNTLELGLDRRRRRLGIMCMLKKSGKKNIEKFKIAVIDTIFAPKKVTRQDVENFRFIPGTGNKAQFIMEAGIITTESKVVIPVVECRAPYKAFLDTVAYRQEVINLIDEEQNNFNRYPGVKFGSMDSGNNEAGNWE